MKTSVNAATKTGPHAHGMQIGFLQNTFSNGKKSVNCCGLMQLLQQSFMQPIIGLYLNLLYNCISILLHTKNVGGLPAKTIF